MILGGSFGKQIDILRMTMDAAVFRHSVISDNIANSDTPNFKRSAVNFESELKRALDSEKATAIPALLTDPRHISFSASRPKDYRTVSPKRVWDYLTTSKNNGNNVDIEQESMNLLENQLLYTALTNAVNSEFSRVNMVLK